MQLKLNEEMLNCTIMLTTTKPASTISIFDVFKRKSPLALLKYEGQKEPSENRRRVNIEFTDYH